MATFVAAWEQQQSAELEDSAPRGIRSYPWLLLTALTIYAFLVAGYHPFAEDGGIYLASVERQLHPALFPHDAGFVMEPVRYSLFADFLASIVRVTHLQLLMVAVTLHLFSIWLTLAAAWELARRCWRKQSACVGAVTLLACWLSLPVAGTALAIMDPYLTARSFSTPLTMWMLVGTIDATAAGLSSTSKVRAAIFALGAFALAAVMHPLMAAYGIAAAVLLACLRPPNQCARRAGPALIVAAAVTAALAAQLTASPQTPQYRAVALTRTYWFPGQWAWYETVGLTAPLLLLVLFLRTRPSAANDAFRSVCRMAVCLGAIAWLAAALFCRVSLAAFTVARLQPLRAFQLVYLVMLLTLGAHLAPILKPSAWRWACASLLLAAPLFAAARGQFPASPHLELPGRPTQNSWVQAFRWIRIYTPPDALFALDAHYISLPGEEAQGFRAVSERSALPDYSKDGGEASIAPELEPAWTAAQQALEGLNDPGTSDANRLRRLRPFGVTWLVLEAQTPTQLPCPYSNSAVKVCRL